MDRVPVTPTNRARLTQKTRFGSVTRVSPGGTSTSSVSRTSGASVAKTKLTLGAQKAQADSAHVPKKSKARSARQRRTSGASTLYAPPKNKSYTELKKSEEVLSKENEALKAKLANLTSEMQGSIDQVKKDRKRLQQENMSAQERMEMLETEVAHLKGELARTESDWRNRSAELEFEWEEKRISDTQDFEDKAAKLQEDARRATDKLNLCRDAIERHNINAVTLQPFSIGREETEQNERAVQEFTETLDRLSEKLDNSMLQIAELQSSMASFRLDDLLTPIEGCPDPGHVEGKSVEETIADLRLSIGEDV